MLLSELKGLTQDGLFRMSTPVITWGYRCVWLSLASMFLSSTALADSELPVASGFGWSEDRYFRAPMYVIVS